MYGKFNEVVCNTKSNSSLSCDRHTELQDIPCQLECFRPSSPLGWAFRANGKLEHVQKESMSKGVHIRVFGRHRCGNNPPIYDHAIGTRKLNCCFSHVIPRGSVNGWVWCIPELPSISNVPELILAFVHIMCTCVDLCAFGKKGLQADISSSEFDWDH
ncbi:hypothetical protein BD410DRAFT_20564 [Rickenella mellea]|uniref:Uncharacterized protein n=1 Tax=Rickenella mellea TaxID=50990 RepID=A0A4R5XGS3_9AGAM|nr:hypothetical protein BD410DRAFT_20564 [Rickenella mellea]